MNDPNKKPPALWLEQAALNELSEGARASLHSRIDEQELTRQRQLLAQDNAETLLRLPSARMVAAITQRAKRNRKQAEVRSWMPGPWTLAPVMSLAALLLIVMSLDGELPTTLPTTQPTPQEGSRGVESVRLKGLAPHLLVYRRSGETAERLTAGSVAKDGDRLQLAYVAAGDAYGVVVSLDGAGAVTLHLHEGPRSAALKGDHETPLSESYRLDAAPGFERFVLVTSATPFDVSVVESAARALIATPNRAKDAELTLPGGLRQVSFTLNKAQQ